MRPTLTTNDDQQAPPTMTDNPTPTRPPLPDLNPDTFINRELGWLEFNRRVLAEAQYPNYPLLERVNARGKSPSEKW